MKVLLITPYPHGEAPSQRFRFEQYYQFMENSGIQYDIAPFITKELWQVLYLKGNPFQKVFSVLKGFWKRLFLLFNVSEYDFIFIHREATPLGPPWVEWVLTNVLRKRIIYDFDDAIWLPNTSQANRFVSYLKWNKKVDAICRWAYKVSCGNEYLCEYARKFNSTVVLNPTTIDTSLHHNRLKNQDELPLTIGWTGTHSTIEYLYPLLPVLEKLEKEINFRLLVISNFPPEKSIRSLEFRKWKKSSEIDDLLEFNVGIMPLSDDQWSRGKCGFKALQYMSLGMPAVVSPVGVNASIVEHGTNGFLAVTDEEWYSFLKELLVNAGLRKMMGLSARKRIEDYFSVAANKGNFLSLFS